MTLVKTKTWRCNGCSSGEEVIDQRPIQFQDEGEDLGGVGTVRIVNFVGTNVEAVRSGNTITVTVTGGGGTSFEIVEYADFEASGLPTGESAGYIARIVTSDPDYQQTIDGIQYYNNKIIYFDGTNWISWAGDYGGPI